MIRPNTITGLLINSAVAIFFLYSLSQFYDERPLNTGTSAFVPLASLIGFLIGLTLFYSIDNMKEEMGKIHQIIFVSCGTIVGMITILTFALTVAMGAMERQPPIMMHAGFLICVSFIIGILMFRSISFVIFKKNE